MAAKEKNTLSSVLQVMVKCSHYHRSGVLGFCSYVYNARNFFITFMSDMTFHSLFILSHQPPGSHRRLLSRMFRWLPDGQSDASGPDILKDTEAYVASSLTLFSQKNISRVKLCYKPDKMYSRPHNYGCPKNSGWQSGTR